MKKPEDYCWYIIKRAKNNYSLGIYDPRMRCFSVIGCNNIEVNQVDSYAKIDPEELIENNKKEII